MIEIDGSAGEGGGQVLRTALSLSAWRQQPVLITGIRARRRQPGLKAQHLTAVAMIAQLCDARVEGGEPGSTTLAFRPGAVHGGATAFAVGTAGATTLVAQAALPPLWAHGLQAELTISGGTHVAWSPPVDHLRDVFAPTVIRLGLPIEVELVRYGFYPRGGGRIKVTLSAPAPAAAPAAEPRAIVWERPARRRIRVDATALVAGLPRHIAERMLATAGRSLRAKHWRARERILEVPGGPGAYLFIRISTAADAIAEDGYIAGGFIGLGAPGKPAEVVAEEAVGEALGFLASEAALDSRLADQIVLPALAARRCVSFLTPRVSRHLQTNAATLARFLGPCVEISGEGRVTVRPG
ncbi:MAG: RNA 3'-phosphate cyclase [Candidatus Eisenbacteria sp.]|nr:RNA 3'-phosphate cyclase [Candidatus Eisenbacteria bacterium]